MTLWNVIFNALSVIEMGLGIPWPDARGELAIDLCRNIKVKFIAKIFDLNSNGFNIKMWKF